LDEESARMIADADSAVFVSAASTWETSIKKSHEKLEAPADLPGSRSVTDSIQPIHELS
jgi:PIN domain nuclease of toxin-antitoxin system